MEDELDEISPPNCPEDLIPMEAFERAGTAVWECPGCGLIRI
jgi:ribosomal protein L37AE/L43A